MVARIQTRLVIIAVMSLMAASHASGQDAPKVRLTMETGLTDNLYYDSSATADELLDITLDTELPVHGPLAIDYNGRFQTFSKNPELESYDHEIRFGLASAWKQFTSLRLDAGADRRLYNGPYEIYRRHGLFLSGGAEVGVTDAAQLRLAVDLSSSTYPQYVDERVGGPGIDYSDLKARLGVNTTVGANNAVDVAAGFQQREFSGEDGPTTTLFVLAGRLSRPLGRYTGIALTLTYHDETNPGTEAIYTFYGRGVNITDHLWDGFDASLAITRFLGQWKLRGTAAYRNADYLEVPVDAQDRFETPRRKDESIRLAIDARRVLMVSGQAMRIWGFASYQHERNYSNWSMYDYDLNEIHLGLIFEW